MSTTRGRTRMDASPGVPGSLQQFLEEHTPFFLDVISSYVARMGLAHGDAVRSMAMTVLQETVIETLTHLERFANVSQPRAWFLAVAANVLKRKRREIVRQSQCESPVSALMAKTEDIGESAFLEQVVNLVVPGPEQEVEDMIYEMHHLYQQEDQLKNQSQEQNFPAPQENPNQEGNIPGQRLPISHARRPSWQRVRLTLQTLAAVLVAAVLISGSILLFTSRSSRPGTGSHSQSAVATQGMVIVLLEDGSIHAYRGGTGENIWSYPTHQAKSAYSGLVVQKQVVYTAVGANIYALHENDGTLIWHKTLPFQPNAGSPNDSQFLVDSGIVYASANSLPQSALYAMRSSDGQVLWHITSDQPPLLTANNGVAYVAITAASSMQTQTTLKALRGADEHELWHSITRGTLLSATVTNNVAYIYAFPGAASLGGNKYNKQLLAFNTSNGSQIWSHNVNSGNYSRLEYIQGELLLSTGDKICAHSTHDGAQLWCTPNLADAQGDANIAYLVGPDKVYVAYVTSTSTPLMSTLKFMGMLFTRCTRKYLPSTCEPDAHASKRLYVTSLRRPLRAIPVI
ncbi:PQQ-binding-like beta-propeller repeat protein [Ktedonobacter racemifer]|uniref:WD40 repeat containing protein n=1 Tax=Ktedonobacter racemifer DSM 44963 TaxID=485913 RepID=D6TUJ3_KTERA|nr:PQQ-binding-like beta-propeller repeat protein [Ktedonobacter racemifer]EFH84061.1 WD40 repeat containing protein [Ktedonobacter racemifer DSM 44963]